MIQKTIIINYATISSLCGAKSIPPGVPCSCIVITRAGTCVPWLSKGANIRYDREK